MRSLRVLFSIVLMFCLGAGLLSAQKKKKKKKAEEEITQTLELPKDPPGAITADPRHLVFLTAPMSSKGLLSQQVRDGLKAMRGMAHGAHIVKVRAFVAGTGDLRRVAAIVSDVYTDAHQPIPAVAAIQVGALPQEGAQVWLEGIGVDKKAVNPHGVAFLSGQAVTSKEPMEKVAPLLKQSLDKLRLSLDAINVPASDMLRVTCFGSALGDAAENRTQIATGFPKAAVTVVQLLRGLSTGLVECEGVARLASDPPKPLTMVNPPGIPASANYSQVALVNSPKVIITGTQMGFNNREEDIRLAFDRLSKTVEASGGSLKNTAITNFYPLAQSTMDKIRAVRFSFLNKAQPPASTMVLFEGLPSHDASFAAEVVVVP